MSNPLCLCLLERKMNLHIVIALALLISSQAQDPIRPDGSKQCLVDEVIWKELMRVKCQLIRTQQEMEGDLLNICFLV